MGARRVVANIGSAWQDSIQTFPLLIHPKVPSASPTGSGTEPDDGRGS